MGSLTEHMEHVGHADKHGDHGHGGGGGGPGKGIGITMAMLGVLLALTAAMVGSERTELTRTMVEQTNAHNLYQAESMKHRMMISELEMLHALTPSKSEVAKFEESLGKIRSGAGKGDNPEVMSAIELSSREIADILSPDHEDLLHFVDVIHKYEERKQVAKEWYEAYDPSVEAHFEAAEWYEKAQLLAEIGIVIASIALLMSSRPFWIVSMVAGVSCAGLVGYTWVTAHRADAKADASVAKEKADYDDINDAKVKDKDDEELIDRVTKGDDVGNIPSSQDTPADGTSPAPPQPGPQKKE
jgi:hypothetical protein